MAMSLFCTIASANISDENVNSARERLLRSKPNPTYTLDKQGHDHRKLMCAPDTTAPSVSTGIENQFLCGVGGAGVGLQDLHFTFTAEDNCDPDKLEISIKLWSNEVTAKEPDMFRFSTGVPIPAIYVEDHVCDDNKCTILTQPRKNKFPRQYWVEVTAKDTAGNIGTHTSSTVVGGTNGGPAAQNKFLLGEKNFVGGSTQNRDLDPDLYQRPPCAPVVVPGPIPGPIPGPGFTGKFYVVYSELKCARDCDDQQPLPCMGNPPPSSGMNAARWPSADACCDEKLSWVDQGTCVSKTNGDVPNPPDGSNEWWVNKAGTGTCVMDCVGAAPCGGLKLENNYKSYSTKQQCCDSRPWDTNC